jgi:streptomycin 6-kinase
MLIERAHPGDSMDVHFSSEPFACVEPAIEVLRSILLPPGASADVQYLDDWVDRFRRFRETEFPADFGEKALAIFEKLSAERDKIFYIHGDFHPGNIVTSGRSAYLAIDPKGLIGHVGYDISVFLNNLHWWQKGKPDVQRDLFAAAEKFAAAFEVDVRTIREAAFAGMVIGAWWNFEDMPEHYDNEVVLADIWEV